jgi:hypothetical protein
VPELNPFLPGVYLAGNAGDGGVISTNGGRVVLGPNAGNVHWFNAADGVCQFYTSTPKYGPAFVAVNFQSGIYRELLAGGVSKIVAGFGRWFVASIPYGPMLDGQSVPQMNVRAFGPGGAMAWFPWNGTGLIYRDASVRDVTLSTTLGPEDPIQLIDGGVVWAEGGRVHSWNLPQFPVNPVVVPGGFGWVKAVRIGGVYYLAYQSYALASVVFHPANELVGYRWPAPLAYRLDAGLLNDVRPRLVWSASDADDPAHIVVNDVDLSLPRIALGAPVPVPVPTPVPVPVPVPEPKPMPLKTVPMPARIPAIVQALYAQHVDLAEGDDDQRRALQMLVCEQARFELGPAYGAKKSAEGHPSSKDSIAYLAPDGVLYAADCFNGSTRKPAVPSVFEEIGGQVFIPVQSVDHLGAATGGGSTPAPVPAGSPGAALDATIATLKADIAALVAKLTDQAAKIEALAARPVAISLTGVADGSTVALKSHDNGEYVTVEPGGDVNAKGPRAFGAYQLFTIEVQQ